MQDSERREVGSRAREAKGEREREREREREKEALCFSYCTLTVLAPPHLELFGLLGSCHTLQINKLINGGLLNLSHPLTHAHNFTNVASNLLPQHTSSIVTISKEACTP